MDEDLMLYFNLKWTCEAVTFALTDRELLEHGNYEIQQKVHTKY